MRGSRPVKACAVVAGVALVVALGAAPGRAAGDVRVLAQDGEPAQARLLGGHSFQLSVDGGRTWTPPRAQASTLHLRTRTFDPVRTPGVAQAGGGGAFVVQFAAAPLQWQLRQLRSLDVRVGAYLPEFAYVVRMGAAARARVAALPFVRWVGRYEPADKIEPAESAVTGPARYVVTLVEESPADQRIVADTVVALGGGVLAASADHRTVQVRLDPAQLRAVAGLEQVLAIDRWRDLVTTMNVVREVGGANYVESVAGYTGQGVRGEVMDAGFLETHQEFKARPPIRHVPDFRPLHAHGTSSYGVVFSSGVDPKARGLLPDGQGIMAGAMKMDRYQETAELVNPAGPYRAVFQTNSWASGHAFTYTVYAAQIDDIIFDHDILICQSQGNQGSTWSTTEAHGKNVVSVGGIWHWDSADRTDDQWQWNGGGASIGPTADGRTKPDLSYFFDNIHAPSNPKPYVGYSGTSAAAPQVCGHAGLVFQMWADGVFAGQPGQKRDVFTHRPHAATAKALLINTAWQYPFTGETHDLTRVHQGWGTPNVRTLYDHAKAGGFRLPVLVNETDLLTIGQTRTYTLTTDGTQPLRATLVYADPAAAPNAARTRVNDLSLRITAPNGTTYWGNNGLRASNWSTPGGQSNTVDTVENVFVEHPATGTWTIDVIASEINADSHVETPTLDADFALVATGGNPAP